jgi:DNA-binding IclR family transcriptional regulator
MPCVSPDGKPTESGVKMLGALKAGKSSPEEIAAASDMPLFRVRSGIRELVAAGYATESDGSYALTDQGVAALS